MKRIAIITVLVVLGVVGFRAAQVGQEAGPPKQVRLSPKDAPASQRTPAANFKLNDLNGKPIELSNFKGKVVLLDFWATWCPPCRAMIPHLKALYAIYQRQGFEIIGVSLDEWGVGVVRPFVRENKIPYHNVIGNRKLTQAYGGIRGIPTTFLIDKEGRIAKKFVGYHDKGTFEREIEALLAE